MDRLCVEALRGYQRALFGLDHHDIARCSLPLRTDLVSPRNLFDPSTLFPILDQPKPQHSYIGLIAMAILSSPDKKMVLSEVSSFSPFSASYALNFSGVRVDNDPLPVLPHSWVRLEKQHQA